MLKRSIMQRAGKWLAVAALLGCGLAMAQSEPTLNQVYDAANAGHMEQAQAMMQQVLVAHPSSGKAHYVQAELAARQGQMGRAREELATAEKLAPGLPSIKPEAVQALRAQLAARSMPSSMSASPMAQAPAAASSFPWGLALAIGGGLIALAIVMLRKKPEPQFMAQVPYPTPAQGNGLVGPQGFGMGGGGAVAPGYGPGGYAQPQGSGIGGHLMGGLATGLAVGAGVMAAEAIGKSLMGGHEGANRQLDSGSSNNYDQPFVGNNDMGGQNFGVSDAGSWDDGGSVASSGDGGGWDS